MKKFFSISGIVVAGILSVNTVYAAVVVRAAGKVEVKRAGEKVWQTVEAGMKVGQGDLILTRGIDSGVDIDLDDSKRGDRLLRLGENTQVVLRSSFEPDKIDNIDLDSGSIFSKIEKIKGGSTFEVYTLTAVAGVRGTEWRVNTKKDEEEAEFDCYQGKIYVKAFGRGGEILKEIDLGAGYTTSVKKFQPPAEAVRMSKKDKDDWKIIRKDILESMDGYDDKVRVSPIIDISSGQGNLGKKKSSPQIEDIFINDELAEDNSVFYSTDLRGGKIYLGAEIDAAEDSFCEVYLSLDNGASWQKIANSADFEYGFVPQADVKIPIMLKACNEAGECTVSDKIRITVKTDNKRESLGKFMNVLNNAYRVKQLSKVMACFSEDEFAKYANLEEELSDFFEAVQINSSQIDLAGVNFSGNKAEGEIRWSASVTTLGTHENLLDEGTARVRLKQVGDEWKITYVDNIAAVMYGELSEEVLAANLPDLIIKHVDAGNTQVKELETTIVTVEVENQGKAAAEDIDVNVYDDNAVCPESFLLEGTKSISRLEAGHSASVTVSFLGLYPYGNHKIRAVVDEDGKIKESVEDNNTSSAVYITVTETVPEFLP